MSAKDARAAAGVSAGDADSPRLLIDARKAARGAVDPGQKLLGLPLLRRTALTARRAGLGHVFVLADAGEIARFRDLLSGITDVAVGAAADAPETSGLRTICFPATVLAERAWLDAAAEAPLSDGQCLACGGDVVICRTPISLQEIERARHRADARDGGPGPTPMPLQIRDMQDLRAARRRLLRSLVKPTDGFMARHVERPLSLAVSRLLAATPITPNQMTVVSVLIGVAGAAFFLSSAPLWQTVGALLFLAHSILDGCDGELARLKFLESRWGGVLDFWGDNVVHAAVFACMALGWSRAADAPWPLALGGAAVLATLGSAAFVYWRVMRPSTGTGPLYTSVARTDRSPLTRLLDALSRRDFIYLVVLLSLFGKAAWFLALAAVGAPIFFVMLLVVAASESKAAHCADQAPATGMAQPPAAEDVNAASTSAEHSRASPRFEASAGAAAPSAPTKSSTTPANQSG